MEADRYYGRRIERTIEGERYRGRVGNLVRGVASKQLLYEIRYDDGDTEHISEEEIKKCSMLKKKGATSKSRGKGQPNNEGKSGVQEGGLRRNVRLGKRDGSEEEELVPLRIKDRHVGMEIQPLLENVVYKGTITGVFQGATSGTKVYHVEYDDGDEEDITLEVLRQSCRPYAGKGKSKGKGKLSAEQLSKGKASK